MRLVSRILIGVTAATMMSVAAPVAANAATAPASSATHYYQAGWGPYSSPSGKSKAEGQVTVDKKVVKVKVFVKKWKRVLVCKKDKHGKLICKKVWRLVKVPVWKTETHYPFKVDSTLHNYKWWGKYGCAWETFKVVGFDGSTYYKSFRNCGKHPKSYSFTGKNAKHIFVDVSRGNPWRPKNDHSGYKDVYHHA